MRPFLPFFMLLILCPFCLMAQVNGLYTYQQLSKTFYAKQKDSLKKAWICPAIYKDKATKKKYQEIWDSRTDFIVSAIDNQDYVFEPEVGNYIQAIIDQISLANPERIRVKPFLLIDRSSAANAYALGGNVIVVNLGLLDFAQSREEIALAIAHELSHNILNHVENVMRERAEWLTSDAYKQSLNAVLDSKYERLTRLEKVLTNYSFDRSRHQRYHENDADSLAVILLKKSRIAFNADFFLRLDSADLTYEEPLAHPLKEYFTPYNLPFEESWTRQRSKGLSTRNYSFRDASTIEDSLKTHPDCPERYKRTLAFSDNAKPTPIPATIKEKTDKMLIWNIYDNMNLAACLYRILQEKDKGVQDEWYTFMMYNIFNGLYYNDKELHRFIAIGVVPKEFISKDYYGLQNFLEQMPRETLLKYCTILHNAGFWSSRSTDERALKNLIYTLAIDSDDSGKTKQNAVSEFLNQNSTSMYCEFADQFKRK
jgi:Peptidase family M48